MGWEEFKKLLAKYKVEQHLKHRKVDVVASTLYMESPEGIPFCPLSCVASYSQNKIFSFYHPGVAGYALDMDRELWVKIADAADAKDTNSELRKELEAIIMDNPNMLQPATQVVGG